jgi:DNA-directed RNA polymerase specialized sigma subunit
LTSEYLKQLQLTKQLEQKAKDAAKTRRSAEEKLSEAEKGMTVAQAMGADVKEVQRALADGRAAFAKRGTTVRR